VSRRDPALFAAVFAVGVAARLIPLGRSPLPYNTDGFVFASGAERALAADAVALTGPTAPAADQYLFVSLAAVVSELTGVAPLYVLQGLVACLGVVPALVAVAYVRPLLSDLPRASRRGAAAFVGVGLALDGPYLFRTMSVNGEVLGLAVLFPFALALHRAVQTERPAWIAATVALAATLPVVHNLTALVAGLVATVLVALSLARRPTARRVAAGAVGVAGFWALTVGYYELVALPKAGAVTASLGLFVAWIVVVVALARWIDTATPTVQRVVPLAPFAAGAAVFALNAVAPVFPGTATSSPRLLALAGPLVCLLGLAALGAPRLATRRGLAVFAVVVAPLAAVGFAFTGGSTPLYQDLALRASTFLHPGALVAVSVALAVLRRRRPALGRFAVAVAVVALVASAALPFAGLGTIPFEPVTEPAEFDAVTVADDRAPDGWATDAHLALVADNYRSSGATAAPVAAWLRGDTGPPDCPTLARDSWTTVGAPTAVEPHRISRQRYEEWLMNGSVVYASGGADGLALRWADGACSGGVSP